MSKVVRVSQEVYEEINRRSKSMKDTADTVIRREFGMPQKGEVHASVTGSRKARSRK